MTGTLKARVGGAWVPILGSGQDAAATARWNSAWGVVGEARATSDYAAITNATTTVADMSVTITAVAGRVYEISGTVGAGTIARVAANSRNYIHIQRDGTTIGRAMDEGIGPIGNQALSLDWSLTDRPTAGTHTYSLLVASGAGDSVYLYGAATAPRMLVVSDVGPITPASVAPPAAGPRVVASGNALGIVALGSLVPSPTIPTNTWGNITNALAVTLAVGRRYRVRCAVRAVGSTAGSLSLRLSDYSTVINDLTYVETYYGGAFPNVQWEWIVNGDDAPHSYTVQLRPQNGPGTVYTDALGLFYVEDVGPNTTPALPIPATDPPWNALPFTNGWTNYGAPWVTGGYRKIGDWVTVRGLVRQPTVGTQPQQMALLPVGFRPPADLMFMVYGNNVGGASAGSRVDVTAAGGIMHWAPGGTTIVDYCTISNVQFSTTA